MSLTKFYPYPAKKISLVGHDCAYIDEGRGTPMVFLHGFSVHLGCFAKNYPYFARHRRVIGLEYPGYYLSQKKDAPYDIPFMARCVAELIEKLHLKQAVLVGSSMGGTIALEAAIARPDLVSALVLAAPGGFSGRQPLMSRLIDIQLRLFPRKNVIAAMSRRLGQRVPTFFADKAHPFIGEIIKGYEGMKTRDDYELWIMTLVMMARSLLRTDLRRRAREIVVPALIVWGDKDEVLPPAGADLARRAMGDRATVVTFPNVGHLPFIEEAKRFNKEVDGFLASLGR